MSKKRFKAELFAPQYNKAVETEDFKKLTHGADRVSVEAMSNQAAAIPLIGFMLPSLNAIFTGGVASLYSYDGARVYQPARLPAHNIINLWRRKLLGEVGLPDAFNDLADLGWSEERVEALIRSSEAMPSPQDATAFLAHEVFEPDMVKKYGLDDEWENVDKTIFGQIGMPEDVARMYWLNHWKHPSYGQMVEFRRRELITDDDLWEWFKLVEIPPYWRDKLMAIVWETPTRVDVRRFWDMGTIDEARLRQLYTAMGYSGENLEDYVLWTKVYVSFPDLVARYKNGYLTADDVVRELVALGMTEGRANELLETKIKKLAPERLVKERDLTLSNIYKGVKADKLDRATATALIAQMGYDSTEAALLLDLYAPDDEVDSKVTARILSKADIKAGLKTGDMTEANALERLVELRYSPADSSLLLSIMLAVNNPPGDDKSRALTRADIIAGVKAGLLTQKEGFSSLLDMGFDKADAEYILTLKAEASPFSPTRPSEFGAQVNNYRKAVGMDFQQATDAALAAEQSVISAKTQHAAAINRQAPQSELVMYEALVREAEINFEAALAQAGD